MITNIRRSSAPFYVQFELTERCNNRCFFCYNPLGHIEGKELNLEQIKDILLQLHEIGVFRINFNGGEPFMREDFCEIIEFADNLGFELHLNTNSTLINDKIAKFVSQYMASVCTSILSSKREEHDRMTGRIGAYDDVVNGIKAWRKNNIKVEVNVCTSTENYLDMYNIGRLIAKLDCYALCSTRYILNDKKNKHLLLNGQQTMELIDLLFAVKTEFSVITDVSLPGPVPYCEIDKEYYEKLRLLNIPCQYGYGLARINPSGNVTPCTISNDIIGNLTAEKFKSIWDSKGWEKYKNLCHIPIACRDCEEFSRCRGGCVVYDESIITCGEKITIKKWSFE
jgi:radical SAM protein with 4Fe4S-binding SPASM domain